MKLPKIDAFRNNVRIVQKPGAPPPPQAVDPGVQKKRQEAIKRITEKAVEIEKALNGGDYKRAYKLASGELQKYTAQSIKGNELLERMASMAETALEYMNSLLPAKDDDWFLEMLGGEMDDYKAVPLFQAVERVLAERLKKKLGQFKDEGKPSWIAPWLETWRPVVEVVDEQKTLNRWLAGEAGADAIIRWKFKIPARYSPGEKQRLGERRRKIHEALASKAAELEKEPERTRATEAVEAIAVQAPTMIETPKLPKSTGGAGTFSRKKATTVQEPKPAPPQKAHKPHPKQGKPKPLADQDDHISSSEVKEYLYKLKYEQKVNEVHFIKIKNDLNAISLNKEKKLFKILMGLVEKGLVIKKTGSVFAILF
ncbi:MAG: hypothetical protein JW839_14820 [Candidatus Lokiarchaeota archaeon]|nr:hypothetical protein [Candidatus Lokiarchaeota archaeon]